MAPSQRIVGSMIGETETAGPQCGNNQHTLTLAGELGQWIMTERRKKCQRESGLSEERFNAGSLTQSALNRIRDLFERRLSPHTSTCNCSTAAPCSLHSTKHTSPSCRLSEQEDSPVSVPAGSSHLSMRVLCPQRPVEATLPAHPALLMPRLLLTRRAP